MADEARPKDELEHEKLELEVAQLRDAPQRQHHAERRAIWTLAMSTATTIMLSLFGALITYVTYSGNQAQHALDQSVAERQHKTEIFEKLTLDVGSEKAAARAGAVAGLAQFIRDNDERSRQTITILTTRLGLEDDPAVVRVLVPVLVDAGESALDEVVQINRDARNNLTKLVRQIVRAKIADPERYAALPLLALDDTDPNADEILPLPVKTEYDRRRARGNSLLQMQVQAFVAALPKLTKGVDFDLLNIDERSAMVRSVSNWPPVQELPQSENFANTKDAFAELLYWMTASDDRMFGIGDELAVLASQRKKPAVWLLVSGGADPDAAVAEASRQTRLLFLSSMVLGRMLKKGDGARHDLHGIALLGVDLADAKLSHSLLYDSILSGSVDGASFVGAKMADADLSHLNVSDGHFDYAWLDGAQFPVVLINSSFHGADWWDGRDADTDGLSPNSGKAIALLYRNGKLARMQNVTLCLDNDGDMEKFHSEPEENLDLQPGIKPVFLSFCGFLERHPGKPLPARDDLSKNYPKSANQKPYEAFWRSMRGKK